MFKKKEIKKNVPWEIETRAEMVMETVSRNSRRVTRQEIAQEESSSNNEENQDSVRDCVFGFGTIFSKTETIKTEKKILCIKG